MHLLHWPEPVPLHDSQLVTQTRACGCTLVNMQIASSASTVMLRALGRTPEFSFEVSIIIIIIVNTRVELIRRFTSKVKTKIESSFVYFLVQTLIDFS